jgi:DNA-binding response OmpR family regulator
MGLTLLLTLDPTVEEALSNALLREGEISCLAQTSDEAMRVVGSELELAVIDFDHGSNGMTLMSAIDACANYHLPMVALTAPGEEHARFVALANGAAEWPGQTCLCRATGEGDSQVQTQVGARASGLT